VSLLAWSSPWACPDPVFRHRRGLWGLSCRGRATRLFARTMGILSRSTVDGMAGADGQVVLGGEELTGFGAEGHTRLLVS
jgi:hypothetical protein